MVRKTDNKSVKEALTGRDIADLNKRLDSLETTITDGFREIKEGQHTTNLEIEKIKGFTGYIEGYSHKPLQTQMNDLWSAFKYNRLIWYLFTVSMVIITGLVVYSLTHI
jgi:hypothetical protein